MALKSLLLLVLVPLCLAGFPELPRAEVDLPEAFQGIMGNQSSNGVMAVELAQNLLQQRQSCPIAENNCGFVGECCAVNSGNNCCGLLCLASRPAGTKCCTGYLCASGWNCCGETNGCYPEGGDCCGTDGKFCPKDWSCCGNSGHCAPTKDFKCCGNDGTYCPNSDTCVLCKGSDSRTCCQGADSSQIPVFKTDAQTNGGVAGSSTSQGATPSASHSSTKSATTSTSFSAAPAVAPTSSATSSSRAAGTSTTAAAGGGSSGGNQMEFNCNFAVALGLAGMVLLF